MSGEWTDHERRHGCVRVHLRLTATNEGGRTRPVGSGYRPAWDTGATYEGKPMVTSGAIELEEVDAVSPGESVTARLHPAFPEYWSSVTVGQELAAYEGSRCVAVATVIEVHPPVSSP
jgi:translation elongation factor EF-Tu-like GTPase